MSFSRREDSLYQVKLDNNLEHNFPNEIDIL
jgi:hypothetical protein